MKIMRIHELREAAGLTQGQVAVQMGVIQSTISAWEAENYLPKARQIPALANVLGCDINKLFVDSDSIFAKDGYTVQNEMTEVG